MNTQLSDETTPSEIHIYIEHIPQTSSEAVSLFVYFKLKNSYKLPKKLEHSNTHKILPSFSFQLCFILYKYIYVDNFSTTFLNEEKNRKLEINLETKKKHEKSKTKKIYKEPF